MLSSKPLSLSVLFSSPLHHHHLHHLNFSTQFLCEQNKWIEQKPLWLVGESFDFRNGDKEGQFQSECSVWKVEEDANEGEDLLWGIACCVCSGGLEVHLQKSLLLLHSLWSNPCCWDHCSCLQAFCPQNLLWYIPFPFPHSSHHTVHEFSYP